MIESDDLKALIDQKEKELGELGSYRVAQLEATARARQEELDDSRKRLLKLKDDFTYNLALIEERDAELQALETCVAELKEGTRERDLENSELRLALEEASKAAQLGQSSSSEREAFWHAKLRESRDDADGVRRQHAEAQRCWREMEARMRLEVAAKAREAADDAEKARVELAEVLENAGNRRTAEAKLREEAALEKTRKAEMASDAACRRAERAATLKAEAEAGLEASELAKREVELTLQREKFEREESERRAGAREKQLEERLVALRAATERSDEASRRQIGEIARSKELAERDSAESKRGMELLETRRAQEALQLEAEARHAVESTQRVLEEQSRAALLKQAADVQKAHEAETARVRHVVDLEITEAKRSLLEAQAQRIADLKSQEADFKAQFEQRTKVLEQEAAQRSFDSADEASAAVLRSVQPKLQALATERDLLTKQLQEALAKIKEHDRIKQLQVVVVDAPPPPPETDQRRSEALRRRVDEAIDESFTSKKRPSPLSPLFTDDQGDANSWMDNAPSSSFTVKSPQQQQEEGEVERQRRLISAMRGDLEAIRGEAQRRDGEIAAARRSEQNARGQRDEEARALADKVDGLQRELSTAARKLSSVGAEREQLMEISNALRAELRAANRDTTKRDDDTGPLAAAVRRLTAQNREIADELERLRATQRGSSSPPADLTSLRTSLRDREQANEQTRVTAANQRRKIPTTTTSTRQPTTTRATTTARATRQPAKPKIRNYNIIDD